MEYWAQDAQNVQIKIEFGPLGAKLPLPQAEEGMSGSTRFNLIRTATRNNEDSSLVETTKQVHLGREDKILQKGSLGSPHEWPPDNYGWFTSGMHSNCIRIPVELCSDRRTLKLIRVSSRGSLKSILTFPKVFSCGAIINPLGIGDNQSTEIRKANETLEGTCFHLYLELLPKWFQIPEAAISNWATASITELGDKFLKAEIPVIQKFFSPWRWLRAAGTRCGLVQNLTAVMMRCSEFLHSIGRPSCERMEQRARPSSHCSSVQKFANLAMRAPWQGKDSRSTQNFTVVSLVCSELIHSEGQKSYEQMKQGRARLLFCTAVQKVATSATCYFEWHTLFRDKWIASQQNCAADSLVFPEWVHSSREKKWEQMGRGQRVFCTAVQKLVTSATGYLVSHTLWRVKWIGLQRNLAVDTMVFSQQIHSFRKKIWQQMGRRRWRFGTTGQKFATSATDHFVLCTFFREQRIGSQQNSAADMLVFSARTQSFRKERREEMS